MKQKKQKCFPFIVADIETVILNNVLVPYAAGLLVVNPGDDVAAMDDQIDTYFCEDYNLIIPSLEERSTKMLVDFIERIAWDLLTRALKLFTFRISHDSMVFS